MVAPLIVLAVWPDLLSRTGDGAGTPLIVQLLPLGPYLFLSGCAILGARYNNAGLFLASILLAGTHMVLLEFGATAPTPGRIPSGIPPDEAVGLLLPANLVFFTALTRRRIHTAAGVSALALVLWQVLIVGLFAEPAVAKIANNISAAPAVAERYLRATAWTGSLFADRAPISLAAMSAPAQIMFLWAVPFLFVRYATTRDHLLGGFAVASCCVFAALAAGRPWPAVLFMNAASLVLLVSAVEASFAMAYMDDLTGLPGRRALNEALLNLGGSYAVAMVDVDNFKKFNDTYGHETGDHVLKMIGAKMARIRGGARVYRYGGEEFTALFPGRSAKEAAGHMDSFREDVETTPFMVRQPGRKQASARDRGKKTSSGKTAVQVTVSVGVASPGEKHPDPEDVIKAADKLLYKAKKQGRNRVVS